MSLHSLSLNQLVTVGVSEVADSGALVVAAGAAALSMSGVGLGVGRADRQPRT
jgi:hypothetical protein